MVDSMNTGGMPPQPKDTPWKEDTIQEEVGFISSLQLTALE